MKRARSDSSRVPATHPAPPRYDADSHYLDSFGQDGEFSVLWRSKPTGFTVPPVEPRDPTAPLPASQRLVVPSPSPRPAAPSRPVKDEQIHVDLVRSSEIPVPEVAPDQVPEPEPVETSLFPRLDRFSLPFGGSLSLPSMPSITSVSSIPSFPSLSMAPFSSLTSFSSASSLTPAPVTSTSSGVLEETMLLHSYTLPLPSQLGEPLIHTLPDTQVPPVIDDPVSPPDLTGPSRRKRSRAASTTPRRPLGPYVLFARAVRGSIGAGVRSGQIDFDDVTRAIAAQWHGLTPQQRQPYEELARKESRRYFMEKERTRLARKRKLGDMHPDLDNHVDLNQNENEHVEGNVEGDVVQEIRMEDLQSDEDEDDNNVGSNV